MLIVMKLNQLLSMSILNSREETQRLNKNHANK